MNLLTPIFIAGFAILSSVSVSAGHRGPDNNFAHDVCNESYVANGGVDSPNIEYFRALLAKGENAPLDRFLKLWYPRAGDGSKLDSPLFACETSTSKGLSIPKNQADSVTGLTSVPPKCRPDILYSWGSELKSSDILGRLSDGDDWQDRLINPNSKLQGEWRFGRVYTVMSPASTFGYGTVLLRFKMKPNVPYVFFDTGENAQLVSVGTGRYHEFNFKHASLIESVSMGTPEIYDEIVRDLIRFRSGKRVFVYSNHGWEQSNPDSASVGLDRLYNQAVDQHVQTEAKLKANMLELIRMILNGEGRVHYSKDSCRNNALTFSSRFPSFIQPRARMQVRTESLSH